MEKLSNSVELLYHCSYKQLALSLWVFECAMLLSLELASSVSIENSSQLFAPSLDATLKQFLWFSFENKTPFASHAIKVTPCLGFVYILTSNNPWRILFHMQILFDG